MEQKLFNHFYAASITGGCLLPQQRWVIVVRLLNTLSKNISYRHYEQIMNDFCQMTLSSKQILATKNIMTKRHKQAGIQTPDFLPDRLVHIEWLQSKTGVCKVLNSLIYQQIPDYGHSEEPLYLIRTLQSEYSILDSIAHQIDISLIVQTTTPVKRLLNYWATDAQAYYCADYIDSFIL